MSKKLELKFRSLSDEKKPFKHQHSFMFWKKLTAKISSENNFSIARLAIYHYLFFIAWKIFSTQFLWKQISIQHLELLAVHNSFGNELQVFVPTFEESAAKLSLR